MRLHRGDKVGESFMVTKQALEDRPAPKTRKRRSQSGPVVTVHVATNDTVWSTVHRLVKVRALALAHGDRARIVILSPTCVLVGNKPRTH